MPAIQDPPVLSLFCPEPVYGVQGISRSETVDGFTFCIVSMAQIHNDRMFFIVRGILKEEADAVVIDQIGRASCRERVFRAV